MWYGAPWRKVGWYFGMDVGYTFIPGASTAEVNNVKLEANTSQPILELRLGLTLSKGMKKAQPAPQETPAE